MTTATPPQRERTPTKHGKPPVETELKLIVAPEDLAALASTPVVEKHARNGGTVRNLRSVYFDTPDRKLWKAGWTLRVRKSGSRHVMTVKSAGPTGGGMIGRGEWEAPVGGMEPDLSALPEGVPAEFRKSVGGAELAPMVATEVKRRARMLDLPEACIEFAVDTGDVVAGERRQPLCELELELVSGEVGAVYDIALEMLERAPVEMSLYSKAARGFDFAFDRPPGYRKPGKSDLPRDAVLDDAFAAMLGAATMHFVQNRPAALDGRHPEGVHQIRVALRRLRSILKIVHTTTGSAEAVTFGQEARWIGGEHADARNWDVFLTETIPPIASACPNVDGFVLLNGIAENARARGYERSRTALGDMRTLRFPLALARWIQARGWRAGIPEDVTRLLEQPVGGYASAVLDRQLRTVLKRGRKFGKLTPRERHELRLAVKKLRYLTDFLMPLCARSSKAAPFAKALSRLQDGLGRYNDMTTTDLLLGQIATQDRPAALHRACGIIHGWQARDLLIVEKDLKELWKAFSTAKVPWPK